MTKHLTLYTKFALATVSGAVLIASFSSYSILTIRHFRTLFTDFTSLDIERIRTLQETRLAEQALENGLSQYALHGAQHVTISSADKQAITDAASVLTTNQQLYTAAVRSDPRAHAATATLGALSVQTEAVAANVASYLENGSASFANSATITAQLEQLKATLLGLLKTERTDATAESSSASSAARRLEVATVIMSVASVLFTVMLVVMLIAWISRPIQRFKAAADRIANGDLSEQVSPNTSDIFGQLTASLNSMAARLRDSYRRLAIRQQQDEAILHNIGEGIVAIDADDKVVLMNHVARQYLEIGDEMPEATCIELFGLYPENDTSHTLIAANERPGLHALQTGKPYTGTYSYYQHDQRRLTLQVVATPIAIDGETIRAVILFRDVTKEHEIDRMKTEFISLASHQLRTPLSTMRWFSEMLLAGDAGKLHVRQAQYIATIAQATERMVELVDALLDISRIESGKVVITPEPTNIERLVRDALRDVTTKLHEKHQKLAIAIDKVPTARLDPRLISQVYQNLITNAIKYTPAGGAIAIRVRCEKGNMVSEVSDTGAGIPAGEQHHIFERFFRASNAAKIAIDGTGLGLYLAKIIVGSSGGRIWFKSQEGKGTTFWFSLPLHRAKAKKDTRR